MTERKFNFLDVHIGQKLSDDQEQGQENCYIQNYIINKTYRKLGK